ncbi:DUF1833 family protein [Castellaniella ginsengisoli]|uniref:DUF1833 family protein n=1 Tax=Castellaniella ginsengisoli TaxID=546114 RepID=A0AB39ESF3_9BURK
MPNAYTSAGRRVIFSTSPSEPILYLLEITHPDLDEPVRITSDSVNFVSRGHEYVSCQFSLTLPDDVAEQTPKASLGVANIGRELTQWLEYSRGGKGAKCRIIQCLRSDPDVFEYDMTLDMSGIFIDNLAVAAELGFQNTLMLPAVAVRYDPKTTPGGW